MKATTSALKDGKLVVAEATPEGCLTALLAGATEDPDKEYEIGAMFYSSVVGRERAEALHGGVGGTVR